MSDEGCDWRPLVCPVCGGALALVGRALRCEAGHTFDVAREGYVNLRLSGKGHAKVTGDTRAMLQARRRFLAAGHYAPLMDAVSRIVAEGLGEVEGETAAIVDVGCGEGSYLGRLAEDLRARPDLPPVRLFGVDASKDAARLAAGRHKRARFVVADVNRGLPFAPGSVHVLLNLFAPRNAAAFAQVMAPGALLLVVLPGAQHLLSLRRTFDLLGIEPGKQASVAAQLADDFALTRVERLSHTLTLAQSALTDLVMMTPSAWRLTPAQQAALTATPGLATEAHFELLLLRQADLTG